MKPRSPRAVRWRLFAATVLITTAATLVYARASSTGGLNWLELLSLPLFVVLFAWIAFSFSVATMGFVSLVRRQSAESRPAPPVPEPVGNDAVEPAPCAVLVPVYNESPGDVFARVEAMVRALMEHDPPFRSAFDFFVLSDSTDPEVWLVEELAWSRLTERLTRDLGDHRPQVYYRHRGQNTGRKAGNIADFCERWSGPYPFMIVLDADSLMQPETMIDMVRRMAAEPRLGILQVPPVPIGRDSLLARIQQFSAQAYGPVFVEGFDRLAGSQGNYWGHNAIIRTRAFRDRCDLPVLPGVAPLGGEILSHDFVEAALMVRAGWRVRLAVDLGGSFEECPTTLTDYAQRDQRWCQGNLQHSRLLISEGFHPLSRLHFLSGVMAYVSSPLWILFTVLCVGGWALDDAAFSDAGWLDRFGRFGLFAIAMAMLLTPKCYGLVANATERRARRFGGNLRLAISVILETLWSILISPLIAVLHSRFVLSTLLGKKVKWSAQCRDEHGVTLGEAMRDYGMITGVGLVASLVVCFALRPMAIWFVPILAGLVLAIPIAMLAGSRAVGMRLRRWGWLAVPQELDPPPVFRKFREALGRPLVSPIGLASTDGVARTSAFDKVLEDPKRYHLHQKVLAASEAHAPMADDESRRVREALQNGQEVPVELRRGLLGDRELLKIAHAEIQLRETPPEADLLLQV